MIAIALFVFVATAHAQRPDIQWMRGGFEHNGVSPTPFYSSDGKYLLAYDGGASVKIFDVSSGLLLQTIVPPFGSDRIWAATLSQDSQLFAVSGTTPSGSDVVQVYEFPSGTLLHTFRMSDFALTLSISPDDTLLAVSANAGSLAGYFTIATGKFTPATALFDRSPAGITGPPQFMLGGIAFASAQENPSEVYPGLWIGPLTFPWSTWADYPALAAQGQEWLAFPLSSAGGYITGNNGVVYILGTGCPEPSDCKPGPLPTFTPSNTTADSQISSALSPDGSLLAVAALTSSTSTLQTFATGTWASRASITLPGASGAYAPVIGFSPDSTAIALGDPMIQILNTQDLSLESRIAYDWDLVSSVAYSPDGTFVVSGDLDGQAIAWNTADGSLRHLLQPAAPGSGAAVTEVSIAPNGALVAVATNNGASSSINVYSASTGTMQTSIPAGAGNNYLGVAFLNDSEIVVTGPLTNTSIAAIYSAITGNLIKEIGQEACSTSDIVNLAVFPNRKSIAVNCLSNVLVVDIATGNAISLATITGTALSPAMAVSPNSRYVAVGLNDYTSPASVGRVQVYSAASGAHLHTYLGGKSSVWSVAFSSDSQTIAAGNSTGLLNFWDVSSRKLLQTYNKETGDSNGSYNNPNVSAITYSPDNQHVYYGRNDASSVLINNPVYFPITSLSLSEASVIGGTSVTGTITLSVQAPSYGAKVTFTSSNSGAASAPASVTIPAGQTSATFTITTTAQTAPVGATITANSTGTVQKAALTVLPQPTLTAITLSPTSVTGGGSTTGNTVTLSSAAPTGGVTVMLSSSDTAVAVTPASVVVPAGATVSPVFTITTNPVSAQTVVTISAAYNGVTQQATLNVN